VRDVLITLIVFVMLGFALRQAVFGAYGFAWIGMMNPHRQTFGFASGMPFAQLFALTTLISMFMHKDQRHKLPINGITITLMLFIFWMTVTSFFAINDADMVRERWTFVFKVQFMIAITMMLVRGRELINKLIIVVTYSVGFYGIKGGIWTVLTGGGGRVYGPGGTMIEDNNELAVALVLLVPLMYYLLQITKHRALRWAIGFGLGCCVFSILGSQSRGALLALVSMGLILGLKGKHPVRSTLTIGALIVVAIGFMPDSWTNRMDTMQTYEADQSAMGRIYTWKTLWNAAKDRPLVGAGFQADCLQVFQRYSPKDDPVLSTMFEGTVLVAHSIYLQVIGEHGFPGIILFLLLGFNTWRIAGRLKKQAEGDPEFGDWVPQLMPMIQVSILGFAVGGAFLSMAYVDVPYYVLAITATVEATMKERFAARNKKPPPSPYANVAAATPAG
jgi:probable O-glycosylation ligase (exosortase A-associated)